MTIFPTALLMAVSISCLSATALSGQSNTVTTEPCNSPECVSRKFHYRMCDRNGQVIRKCTSDPNNEPGLRPYKVTIPLVLCAYDLAMANEDHLYPNIKFNISSNPADPYYVDVFRKRQVETCLDKARAKWEAICPAQGPNEEYQHCCLPIRWTRDEADMPNYHEEAYAIITTPAYTAGYDPRTMGCKYDCDNSVLRINRTFRFLKPESTGTPTRFFITDRESIPYLPAHYEYMDMEGMFTHELGHWLGFMHSNEPDENGEECPGSHGSIMEKGAADWMNVVRELTADDYCMFKKLYCCEQTKRKPDSISDRWPPGDDPPYDGTKTNYREGPAPVEIDFIIAPNPSSSRTLKFSPGHPAHIERPASIRFVDAAGNVVLSHELLQGIVAEVIIDVSSLPRGMYMVQFVRAGAATARKIMIE